MPLQLAFEATGNGSPVVILHGLFGSSRNWRGIAKSLAPHHRVYCVDMRNHGQSPWAASMTYSEMAGDMRMLIESEGLDKPVVIGHSMGGKAAMALALESPSLLGRLIVVDIAPVSYVDRFSVYLEAMREVDTLSLSKRADALEQLVQRIHDVDLAGFLLQNLVPRDDHFDWRLNLGAISAAVPELSGFPEELLLRRYPGPVTLIRGSLLDYVQPADQIVAAKVFPAVEVVEVQGAGHWVHADNLRGFLAALALTPESEAAIAPNSSSQSNQSIQRSHS
jgi:esterase